MNGRTDSAMALIVGAALFGLAATSTAAEPKPLAGADRYIERAQANFGNVGVAVAVVRGSDVIYARGFGVREWGKAAPITPDTLFEVGSTTKAFTTAALGILVDEGKIGWDEPVIKYLPEFQLQDPWLTRHLTIRDAVTHRSGVADNFYAYTSVLDKDAVVRQLRYLSAESEFRDSYHYNNLLYAAAGKVLEAASGTTWDEFMKRRVLEPLAMKRSGTSAYQFWDAKYVAPAFYGSAPVRSVHIDQAIDRDVAMPHGLDESGAINVLPWITFDNAAPAGAIVSSATDMANWLVMHVNDGSFAGRQLLKKDTVEELHAPQNLRIGNYGQFPLDSVDSYAMGWIQGKYRGHVHLAHGGGMLGFPAYMAVIPDRKIGVVVLSNGPMMITDDGKFHRSIAFWLFDRLLGAPMRDWGKEFLTQKQAAQHDVRAQGSPVAAGSLE